MTQLASDSSVHGVQLTGVQTDLSELEEKLRSNGIHVSYPTLDEKDYQALATGIADAFVINAQIVSATEALSGKNGNAPILLQFTPGWK